MLALSSSLFVACSNSTSTAPTPDASVDATSPVTDSGGKSDTGTADTGTPPAGDGGTACTDPSACTADAPVCCGSIPITGGTAPNCTTGTLSSSCATTTACPTKLSFACTGAEQVHLCAANADCSEASYPLCCNFGSSASPLFFCTSDAIAGVTGATCVGAGDDGGSTEAGSPVDAGPTDAGSTADAGGDAG